MAFEGSRERRHTGYGHFGPRFLTPLLALRGGRNILPASMGLLRAYEGCWAFGLNIELNNNARTIRRKASEFKDGSAASSSSATTRSACSGTKASSTPTEFLPASGRSGLRGSDHRQGRGAAAAGQDLDGAVLLRDRDALRLPVARHGIRHEDRRMRHRPPHEAEEISRSCKRETRSMSSPKTAPAESDGQFTARAGDIRAKPRRVARPACR